MRTDMPVEFLGMAATHDGTETTPRSGGAIDKEFMVRLARAHEENGWTRVLFAYGSGAPEPSAAAAWVAAHTQTLQILLAHRPNVSAPTFAAKTLATLDQLSDGRMTIHVITGGSDADQQREGDHLPKDARYGRTAEYLQILKRAWTETTPFDYDGEHYQLRDFVSDVRPVQSPRPAISFGGSSAAAYAVGAAEADVFAIWGEPLERTAEQLAAIRAAAAAAGRTRPLRFQVAFRPIIAPTEAAAWERAHGILDRITARTAGGTRGIDRRHSLTAPQNAGSQRLLDIAAAGDRFGSVGWTATARATGGAGNSNALVGTPEQVAAALLEYYDLGIEILSMRGYDTLADAVDVGREVLPIVREGVAARDAARRAA